MLIYKKLKIIPIEFFLFILLIHHVRVEATVTGMTSICTDTTGSLCKTKDGELDNNLHCLSGDGKIYKSTKTDSSSACNPITSPSLFKGEAGNTAGTLGTDSGIIYDCDANYCKQLISTYYGEDGKLYKCEDNGICTKQTEVNKGNYLSGIGVVEANGIVSYTSMITCTSKSVSDCKKVTTLTAGTYLDAGTAGNIITCDTSKCSSAPGSKDAGIAYVDSSTNGTKNVIICTGTTTTTCSPTEKATATNYFIDGSKRNQLIKCDSSNCESNTVSTAAIHPDGTDATNRILVCSTNGCVSTKKITQCNASTPPSSGNLCTDNSTDDSGNPKTIADGGVCIHTDGKIYLSKTTTDAASGISTDSCTAQDSSTTPIIVISDNTLKYKLGNFGSDSGFIFHGTKIMVSSYYKGSNNNYYYCNGEGSCKIQSITKGVHLYGAATPSTNGYTYTKIISCTDTNCGEPQTASLSAVTYIDADNKKNIITCATNLCTSSPGITTPGFAYKNSDQTGKKLIICSKSNGCEEKDPEDSKLSTNGYAYINANPTSPSTAADIIQCSATCTSTALTTTGNTYIDGTNDKNIIYCSSATECSSIEGSTTAGQVYVDSINNGKVITCTNNGCSSDVGVKTPGYAYISAITFNKPITCPSTANAACTEGTAVSAPTTLSYIDAQNNDHIVECTKDSCITTEGNTELDTAYISGSNQNNVIQCTSNKTTTRRRKRNGTPTATTSCSVLPAVASGTNAYYIDATKTSNIITCTGSSTCSASAPASVADGTAYVNPLVQSRVIQCSTTKTTDGATQTNCASDDGATDDLPIVHYINAVSTKKVITCKKDASSVECKEETTTKEKSSGYAYRDYMRKGNVILCDSSTSCTSGAANAKVASSDTVPVQSVGYIDASDTNEQTVITCTDWGTSPNTNITCSTVTVTKADGRAFLDGTSTYDATDGFKKLISFNSGTKKVSQVTTPKVSGNGFAYIDGTDENNKRIIKCSDITKCLAANNDSDEAKTSPVTPAVNAFYIDGTNDKNYIICKPSENCSPKPGTEAGSSLDKYYPDSINAGQIIKCHANNGVCEKDTAVANTVGYYVDGYTNGILSYDATTKKCGPLTTVNTADLTGYINFDTKTVIHCNTTITATPSRRGTTTTAQVATSTSTVCGALPTNGSNEDNYYIDATDSTKIVTCVKSGICTSVAAPSSSLEKAVAYNNPSDSRIIQCGLKTDNGTSQKVCESKEGASESVPKIHYIEASTTSKIITCLYNKTTKEVTCDKKESVKDEGVGYMDYVNKGHIINCKETPCVSSKSPAKAKTDTLPVQNASYIDGYDTTKTTIITCVNKGDTTTPDINCTLKTYPRLPDGHAFLDGTSFASTDFKKILTYNDQTNITSTEPTNNLSTDSYLYIDGSDENLENVIICTGTKCTVEKNKADEGVNAFYINGLNTASIITCTKEDGCISDVGSKAGGHAYPNSMDLKKVIICDDEDDCHSTVGYDSTAKTDSYINADEVSQIIHCPDANNKNCILADSKAGANRSTYFPRYNEESTTSLLNCTYYSNDNTTCELTTTTDTTDTTDNRHVNTIFLNSLYGIEELSTAKPLIKCNQDKKCEHVDPKFDTEILRPLYYPNSDPVNTKDDLIICTKNSEDKVTCKLTKGSEKDVYLNANFDAKNNNKQVIICEEDGCLEKKTSSTATDFRYYVNAGSMNKKWLNDTLIECKDACQVLTTVKDDEIYINEFDTSQTIQCYEEKGCVAVKSQATEKKNEIFLNSSNLKNQAENDQLTNDLIKCVNNNSIITCSPQNGKEDEVYVNSHNTTEIIYCKSNGCKTKASEALPTQPEYYINADTTDEEKLDGDLIKCRNNGSKVTCEVTKGGDGDVYLNANVKNDSNKKPLIMCSKDFGCTTDTSKAKAESLPAYYVNAGSVLSSKLNDTLIECNFVSPSADCEIKQALANEVYRNYGNNTDTHQLIKCNKNGCKFASSSATDKSNEYYLNAGDNDETSLDYDIIECSSNGESIECEELEETGEGVYINSNYSENGDSNQLILCRSDSGCEGIKTLPKGTDYFINAEASDLNNAIIFCSNKKCEKQTPNGTPVYYVGTTQEGEVNGLIECAESEVVADTSTPSTPPTPSVASRRKRATTEEKCKLKSAFTSNGYFLNAGYNKSINQTIICDSNDGCATQKVDLGYYVNAGDETKPIIKCEKEGTECKSDVSPDCPQSAEAKPGNYCYEDNQLKFFAATNSTALSASKSGDVYSFATIPDGGFPGIKRETGSFFKISQFFINRYYQSGVIMIDKNGKLVNNLSSDQSDIRLFDCNDNTKTCGEKPGCTSNTYMYDSENKKVIFCNNSKLEYADIQGYVVDSNRAVGSNHPYIIKCENKKCESIRPKSNSYYENNGYDSTTNALIHCSNNNCISVPAEVGYYVGHDGDGLIQCTSTSSCTYSAAKSKVKYVNSGSNKTSNAIISCAKNGCSAIKAKVGYYLTYSSSLLIQCSSPSSCVEFTPTVNYYDNADSSESSNSIINCVQNSQAISCAIEATNNGYYMSSAPNVLIHCKTGSKCKTVTVKNGIFRGALKGLLGGLKRSIEETPNESRNTEEIEVEEDGKSVGMPRDSDEVYGIIRCVAGKCSALTVDEIAAIPVCEFNNNKCYITLEYAMTKSATTSITAGNICTNTDRSVFYFATDTVVVKPNVISGVTATYVFTTTNSNCLEVNDSYNDMYFTVGSNIYLLDEGSVLQFYESGYYFINTAKNTLVNGNDIDTYNDENVKLYRCNGNSCSITDKPDALTYFTDVNKRIVRYDVNSDSYSFAYEKDIICIFANNKCTPNADLNNREFCVTYKGELALAKQDIKNRETGECYKANSITNSIYGYSQHLYNMNLYSAKIIDETGYYIVSLSTNTTVVSKNYKTKNSNLVIYGCHLSSCKEYVPDENTYYYDARAKNILRYKDGIWSSPANSGYAYISIDPTNTYIYRFTKNHDEIKINAMANYGYYYTVDGEMYHCDRDGEGECSPIKNTRYYFTNVGEVYYCVHDSEEIEPTECTKQACVSGQYYYIDEAYYRCESSSTLVPVMSRYCSYNENVIINFPLALTEELPDKIKQAMDGVEKNNNSTSIVTRRGKNYLESVSGIFTNCTYNVEETKSTFDLVCVNNFVRVDDETDDVKICSMEQLGYVECIEDEENPEKCNISRGFARVSLSVITIVMATLLSILLY